MDKIPLFLFFFFQAEDGIRDHCVTGVQTCALPILTLLRNDAYWRDGEPYLEEVRFVYLPEEAAHVAGMLSGNLDMTWWPSGEILPIYQATPNIEVSIAQSYGYQPIVMRVDRPPFDKPEEIGRASCRERV